MKKVFKSYLILWAVLLVLFNVISFVSVGWIWFEKYSASFWIGYVFITLCFFGQLFCSYIALNKKDPKAMFYSLPLFTISRAGLIVSFIVGGLCMLISPLPYFVGVIVCAIVLALYAIMLAKAGVAAEAVAAVDEKVAAQTGFIRMQTANAENILAYAKSDAVKSECKKVYEALRYSDPMSSSALALSEAQITVKMSELASAVPTDDADKVTALAEEIVRMAGERNRLCKASK